MKRFLCACLCLFIEITSGFQRRAITQSRDIKLGDKEHRRIVEPQVSFPFLQRRPSKLEANPFADVSANIWNALVLNTRKESREQSTGTGSQSARQSAKAIVTSFLRALNANDVEGMLSNLADDALWQDLAFSKLCQGKGAIERRIRLQMLAKPVSTRWIWDDSNILVADTVTSSSSSQSSTQISYKMAIRVQDAETGRRGAAWFHLNTERKIYQLDWVMESTNKGGEASLNLLSTVSKIISLTSLSTAKSSGESRPPTKWSSGTDLAPVRYFAAWNRRDMAAAVDVFAEEVAYDDTAFPEPFSGKAKLEVHLYKCANCFPESFTFEIDDLISDGDQVSVQWHVENFGEQLPYTRGCSFYVLDRAGRIADGIDFVEPSGPIKPGEVDLFVISMKAKLAQQPLRWIPITAWLAYMYVVFFSDGILPGANALQLEQRTWEEVLNLSLNFFLLSPLLHLPFSPVVHPMLEGVFNLLLSWAAMFAGFLSDDRRSKPNLLPMLPIVVGMQFLTSAFLLPYLATRTSEPTCNDEITKPLVSQDELGRVAQICESRALGAAMGVVGTGSIVWGIIGRMDDFGAWNDRLVSFGELLSIDRVGSSFLVDLVIFGLFQAWLVDDDMKRRGETRSALAFLAKYVPFFGMAAYLTLRKPIPNAAIANDL